MNGGKWGGRKTSAAVTREKEEQIGRREFKEAVQLEFDFGDGHVVGEQLPLPLDFGKNMSVQQERTNVVGKMDLNRAKKPQRSFQEKRFGLGDNPTIREQLMKLRMDLPAKGE